MRMTRRAIIGLLVLAALVGATQTLTESHLLAVGEPLLAAQQAIDTGTRYTHVPDLTASPGYVWGSADVVNTYDPYQGPLIDSGGLYYVESLPTFNAYEPLYQVVKDDTGGVMPAGFVPLTGYSEYGTYGGQSTSYGGSAEYGYGNVMTETYGYPSYGSGYGSLGESVYGTVYGTPVAYEYGVGNYTGTSLSYDSYGSYNTYGGSYGSYGRQNTYADTWYTQALPGIGQAIIPLIPPAYQPTGYSTGYSLPAPQQYGGGYYEPAPETPAPTCSITLSPPDIAYGGSTMVSWTSRDATVASLGEVGAVPLSGSKILSAQTTSRTIGLTVARSGRVGACYALLEVAPLYAALPTCVIAAYPEEIQKGQSATLGWRANNATAASLSGYGSVAREGSRTVSPTQTTTYVLTVQGGGRTASCSKAIYVQ